jgi:predicted permease
MVARLAPGVTIPQAQAQVDAFNVQQSKDDPYAQLIKGSGYHTVVASLREDHVKEVKPTLVLLQFGGLFLLLIGGVNLANLLLIRASGRTKELAVRQALGAGGFRLARDVLAETTMLSVAGGLLGVLLGGFGVRLFAVLGTSQLPLGASVSLNGRVIAVSLAAAVMAGILLAGPVVWFNGRTKLAQGLQSEGRSGTSGRAAQRLRHAFIIAQVALAFVLLAGAGLLGLSLKRVLETPPGFRPDNILTGEIALPWKNYRDDASRLAFVERLLPALRAVPGVTLAAINSGLPFSGGTNDSAVRVENYTLRPGESVRAHYLEAASPDYWRLMGIPLLRGRLLEDADNHRKALVCVVDEAFAEHYWPGSNPIGHRIANGPFFNPDNATTIVGEVASVKQNDLRENAGHGAVYFPFAELNSGYFHILVRTPLPPSALAAAIQKAVLALDPELPVDRIRPMQALIDNSLVARRSPAILAGIFAGIALLLAAIGTYGVLAYAVAQRRREIGVRMALGALPRQVLVQFLCSGGALLGAGIALGIAGAWAASSAMRTMLYGIGGLPVAVLAATAAAMALVVFSAITIPARRAARVDPIAALHED